jgi:hypothetical protein
MTNRLRRRIETAEQRIGEFEMTPDKVCEARRQWEEDDVLPDHPKMRELILDIDRALKEMDRATFGDWSPATIG